MTTATPAWHQHRVLLAPAVLLWAWQAEVLALGLVIAVALELPRLLQGRLQIVQADFDRLWSFTSVLFLAVLFYLALSQQGLNAVGLLTGAPAPEGGPDNLHRVSGTALTFLRCLPGILAPFLIAIRWSPVHVVPWSTFSLYEQARARRHPGVPPPEWAQQPMHPGYLYLGITTFAAGMTTNHPVEFLPLLVATLIVSLWPVHNRGHHPITWTLTVSALFAVSLAARLGHEATQAAWEALEERILNSGGMTEPSPLWTGSSSQSNRTLAFGTVGTLQQSSTILLHVTTSDGAAPGLLRDACFSRFHGSTWENHPAYTDQEEVFNPQQPPPPDSQSITIVRASADGETPLAIPLDAVQVTVPPPSQVIAVGRDSYRIRGALPLAQSTIVRGKVHPPGTPPEEEDLRLDLLSSSEQETLTRLTAELDLTGKSPAVVSERLEQWFASQFTYSLYQAPTTDGLRPLVRFLTVDKAGHCEYFATATVLLLRTVGIPARYAVGFSIHDRLDGVWLGRSRDAHAWALFWDGTRWRELDTTPGTWREAMAKTSSWTEPWTDAWSDFWYRFALWRQENGNWQLSVFVVGMIILAWIAWRQLRGTTWQRVRDASGLSRVIIALGLDSPAIALWDALARGYGPRLNGETLRSWLARIPHPLTPLDLEELVTLHERLRFDPAGLTPADRQRLRELVAEAQKQLKAAQKPTPAKLPAAS